MLNSLFQKIKISFQSLENIRKINYILIYFLICIIGVCVIYIINTEISPYITYKKDIYKPSKVPTSYVTKSISPTGTTVEFKKQYTFLIANNKNLEVQSTLNSAIKYTNWSSPEPIFYNNKIFYVNENKVIMYSLADQSEIILYEYDTEKIHVGKLVINNPDFIYITEVPSQWPTETIYNIREINLNSGESRLLADLPNVTYGMPVHMFKSSWGDTYITQGGDGCGGYGKIYRFIDQPLEIATTGSGCISDPNYIGFSEKQNSIFLLSVDANIFPEIKMKTLYEQNIVTGEKNIIFDFKNQLFQDYGHKLLLNEEKTKVALIKKNGIQILDLQSKQIENNIPFEYKANQRSIKFANNLIYISYEDPISVRTINILTGENTNYLLNEDINVKNEPIYLGDWDKKPLFYITNN